MITTAAARPEDVPAIADLAAEMDLFYGADHLEPLEDRKDQIDAALFADPPTAHGLLAWDGTRLVGFASYSYLWPAAGYTGSMFLKELYVLEDARRSGAGTVLMRGLAARAVRDGCSRLEWATEAGNTDAIAFYASLGAGPMPDKVMFRLEGEQLRGTAADPA